MKSMFKKKNPIKKFKRDIREYFFFKDKRPLFDVNFNGIEFADENFKDRKREPYFEYGAALEEVFAPAEIMDIGCANGYLLEYFYKRGLAEIKGLELAESAFRYMSSEVKNKVDRMDLSKSIAVDSGLLEKRYYLVNCTEVGEHIPYKYENIFLNNIERFVERYLVLSWADTWEGWHGIDRQSHVNPRSKRYVKKKLHFLNLEFNKKLTKDLIGSMEKRNVCKHWIDRVMVFEKGRLEG